MCTYSPSYLSLEILIVISVIIASYTQMEPQRAFFFFFPDFYTYFHWIAINGVIFRDTIASGLRTNS